MHKELGKHRIFGEQLLNFANVWKDTPFDMNLCQGMVLSEGIFLLHILYSYLVGIGICDMMRRNRSVALAD